MSYQQPSWTSGYSSGHYTAYTNNNGVWYRYDDSHVTKVTTPKLTYVTQSLFLNISQLRMRELDHLDY